MAFGRYVRRKRRSYGRYRRRRSSTFHGRKPLRSLYTKKIQDSGVTTQYDRTTQYKKKRMPMMKRQAWVLFKKKVEAVLLSRLGTKTVVFKNSFTVSIDTTAGKQTYSDYALYGIAGSPDDSYRCGYRDVKRILDNDPEFVHTGGLAKNGIAMFKSAVIDFRLIGANTNNVEIDLYKIGFWRNGTDNTSFGNEFVTVLNQTPTISGSGTGLSITDNGVTPFQCSTALSATGCKILMKKKYSMAPGGQITFQHRDAWNRTIRAETVYNDYVYNNKWTTVYFWVFRASPGEIDAQVVKVEVTRSYEYAVMNDNAAFNQLNP